MPVPLVALATVGRVAATAAGTAARVGSVAARAGTAAARAGSTVEGAASTAGRAGSMARASSRVITGMRTASQVGRVGSNVVSNASDQFTSLGRGSASIPSGTNPAYSYGQMQRSPQFLNADPHYGMPAGQMHSGYSGLDSAEATTGVVIRRDAPARPLPLNSSTISTMGRAMAWQSPTTLIGKGAQGSFFDFGEQSQGSPYRPQGG